MKIGIDGNEIIHGERAIRRYAFNLNRSLISLSSDHEWNLLYFKFRTPAYPIPEFQGNRVKNHILPYPGRFVQWSWDILGKPSLESMMGNRLDLFHSLGRMLPPKSNLPLIVTVHSVAHLRIPESIDVAYRNSYEAFMKKIVRRADYFICVSESMRQDFITHYRVPQERVKSIPLGISAEFYPRPLNEAQRYVKERFGVDRPYVLYVGGIQANKNIQGILETFAVLKRVKRYSDLMLILAGSPPSGCPDFLKEIKVMNFSKDVRMTGYLEQDQEDLPMLYSAARAFFFPSFWEGWSSPPLEAMACGIPVVASDIEPHHENLGQDALLVNPHQPMKMAEALDEVLSDGSQTAERLKRHGLNRIRAYTWRHTAESTLDFYNHISMISKAHV